MDINLSSMLRLDSQPKTTDEIKRIPISCCKHIQGLHMMNLNVWSNHWVKFRFVQKLHVHVQTPAKLMAGKKVR